MSNTTSRRQFLKILGASAFAAPAILKTELASAQAQPSVPVAATDPMAIALGYSEDATKVDTTKYPKRAGVEGAKQFCSNCVLLVQSGIKIPGKDGEWGKCGLFQSGLVSTKGWCNSWALKAS